VKIHEYQGKELFRKYGVATPRGIPCFSVDEAVEAAKNLGGAVWVVKAQIHAGGRGKGGGVKVAKSLDEVRRRAKEILGMRLVTHQTGPEGQIVRRLLVDRGTQRVALMASAEGGMDIEEVAASHPEKIHTVFIDPARGLTDDLAEAEARKIGLPDSALPQARGLLQALYRCFDETDASLVEINPLILTGDGRVVALDAKLNFDDNALYRHPEIVALRDPDEEDAREREAREIDLAYVGLDGNIGCMVNGAGLAMATLDVISVCGGNPANFLDAGGDADKDKVRDAFKLILLDPKVKAILVNIFGGIVRCDLIAEGVVAAASELGLEVPLVVRLQGNSAAEGRAILADSGLNITPVETLREAGEAAVAAARRAGR
jgi:succinyl-CoA synthetase beta subunit